jgi:hypothetical protein
VDDIVARATAKDPAHRYPDGKSMAEDIEDVLAGRAARHRAAWSAPVLPRTERDGRGHGRSPRVPAVRARPRPYDRGQRGPGPDADGGAALSHRGRAHVGPAPDALPSERPSRARRGRAPRCWPPPSC